MIRLYEKKDHLIKRNPNLTDEQKQEIIELLEKHPSYENKIDWNKSNSLVYEDFLSVLRPLYINDLDPRGLIEGKDYDILYESKDEVLYFIYTYNASRILASNSVEPEMWTEIPDWCGREEFNDKAHAFGHFDSEHGYMKPGAKWCISMQTSDRYWNQYSEDFYFLFWFRNKDFLEDNRKIAIEIDKETWEIVSLFNGADKEIYTGFPHYIKETINKKKRVYIEKEKKERYNKLISMFTLNPQTNRYDYDRDLDSSDLNLFVSDNYDGFTINFGKITGYFDCSNLGLKSLKGAPNIINGDFYCDTNRLTSLKGAPQIVGGDFGCSNNQITSLEGAPQEVSGDFSCENNPNLYSLEGAPKTVDGDFYCDINPNLHSLEGIGEVKGKIYKDLEQ